jgi:hypothetical protein
MRRLSARLVRSFGVIALFLVAALLGTASGVLFAFVGDLPQISALDDYAPATITKVLGRDGSVVGEFAIERRQVVTYDQIPVNLRNAIISAEDAGFFKHGGVDVFRIFATAARRHDYAAADAQALPDGRRNAGAEDQGSAAGDADREAVHEAGNLHDVLQQDVLGPRRVRRGGGVAAVFLEARRRSDSRRGGDDRGHSPGQCS